VPRKPEGQVDMGNAETQFRNAAFVTFWTVGVPVEGIAYRCP
jgi:hypothetical protein